MQNLIRHRVRLTRKLAALAIVVSCAASAAACSAETKDILIDAGCDLATPAVRLVAVAMKFTPTAPASVGLDVLGITATTTCKTVVAAIKADTVPRTTQDYLTNTPYLDNQWRLPMNAELCEARPGAYQSAISGVGRQSPAAQDGNRHTTCQFAKAVRDAYAASGAISADPREVPANRSISAYSAWAGRYFPMDCDGGYPVTCRGGIVGTALVYLV